MRALDRHGAPIEGIARGLVRVGTDDEPDAAALFAYLAMGTVAGFSVSGST